MPVQQAEKNEHFDVIIIGAGFSGLAVADRFAELRPETRISTSLLKSIWQKVKYSFQL